jgi:hypothetical protein
MDKKISIVIMVLLVLSLLVNIVLLLVLRARGDITGFSVKARETEQKPLFDNDVIEINKAELTKCCSFINKQGEEDGCYVLKSYDCAYCSDYCK